MAMGSRIRSHVDGGDLYEIPICARWHLSPAKREPSFGARVTTHRNIPMLDILMLALAFSFFAAGIGYAYACERL
jgi:hypothetical protein